jgi:hypothetical protein
LGVETGLKRIRTGLVVQVDQRPNRKNLREFMNQRRHISLFLTICFTVIIGCLALAEPASTTPKSSASPAKPPTIADAMALFRSGDAGGAMSLMQKIVLVEPANGRNWRTLGQLYFRLKQPDTA